ncbi:ferritin [Adlercreutzia aquisgranensis]|uniref:ferritin n=1 Tax=Adlercreutzia aquisgranensis TaxID=2941323 RepID=UPI00203E21D8|nr:ferritin [Adlercreutzia aquisgranensis]
MDQRVYELLNDQINKELYSSYLYLSFADYYEQKGLKGFANWYNIQAKEELDHALIFRNYLHENSCDVKLLAIDQPNKEFTDFVQPLEAALEHEKYVTSLIHAIYAAAFEAHDYRTMNFLSWFIEEQQEEEDNAETMVTRMKLFGDDAKALYDLDQENAARTYSVPSPLAGKE